MREKVKPDLSMFEGFEPGKPTSTAPAGVRRITVSYGDEYIQPIQFNGFHTGGIEMVVDVPEGADVVAIYEQTYSLLAELGKQQFQRKCSTYLQNLKDAAKQVRDQRATGSSNQG